MRILLTAFSPFNGASKNTSMDVIDALQLLLASHETRTVELPVAFANAHRVALTAAQQFRPDIILSFGEDSTRTTINVETQAYNQQQTTIADNDGAQPQGKTIISGGIPTIATNFPIWPKGVVASLRQTPWPMDLSTDPGTFVCNHVAYHLYSSHFPTLFMHVPALHKTDAGQSEADVQKIAQTVWMFVDKLS